MMQDVDQDGDIEGVIRIRQIHPIIYPVREVCAIQWGDVHQLSIHASDLNQTFSNKSFSRADVEDAISTT